MSDPNQNTGQTNDEEGLDYTGTAGMDIVDGTEHDDTISTLGGDDSLTGGTGADTFVFAPGDGSDTVTDFDTDNDTINLSMFGDDISFDDLTITATSDGTGSIISVPGDTDSETVTITLQGVTTTNVTADLFEFDDAPDLGGKILGTEGDDNIAATEASSQISGGEGDDTFVIQAGQTSTMIVDFTDGDDQIDLSNISGITGFSDLTITADGADVVINLSDHGAGSVRLENVAVADLDADDFVFAAAATTAGDSM